MRNIFKREVTAIEDRLLSGTVNFLKKEASLFPTSVAGKMMKGRIFGRPFRGEEGIMGRRYYHIVDENDVIYDIPEHAIEEVKGDD